MKIGAVDLGGKTKIEAKEVLKTQIAELDRGVEFSYQDKKINISPNSVSFDGDLAYQLFAVDADKTIEDAYSIGRGQSLINNSKDKLICRLWSCRIDLSIDSNPQKITELLKQEFSQFEAPASDAALAWDNGQWKITSEKFGHRFDYQAVVGIFLNDLKRAKNQPIRLILEEDAPKIFQAEVGDLSSSIDKFLNLAPLAFKFEDKTWVAEKADFRSWLGLKIDSNKNQKTVGIDIDENLFKKYLDKKIAPSINQLPQEPKFDVQSGRVSLFKASRDGREIDIAKTVEILRQTLSTGGKEVMIEVKISKAASADKNIDTMGISEIIGTGTSNFAGSPANRRHNIKVGAAAIDGLLIKPGEEFSLIKALGKIDGSTGYLQELVIKQNKTIPEYGGGLCQIGTTVFRTVVNAGLPVTMRRNHSYRVQYYEPAGTDATIYDPWPDFRFINDTQNYILIQTRIEGNQAIFDFWGKKDGRIVEATKPTIYNIVKPAPAKTIETLDLKPGVKKCTEKAHNGASAYFDYKVTYPSGEVKQERFSSHYVPWQEVCLIGVEKLTDPNAPKDGTLPPANPDAVDVIAPTSTAR